MSGMPGRRQALRHGLWLAAMGLPQLCIAAGRQHKLALQVSDNDAAKMDATLSVAANVSRFYAGEGDSVDIMLVAFNDGLHMLREDTSPVKTRVRAFRESMPNVSFFACGQTLQSMRRKEGKEIPLIAGVEVVPAGVVKLLQLGEQGYLLVRP